MSEREFNIIITGEFEDGADQEASIQNFAARLKIEVETVRAILAKAPYVLKKNLPEADAKKYLLACKKSGLKCEARRVNTELKRALEPDAPEQTQITEAAPAPENNPVLIPSLSAL